MCVSVSVCVRECVYIEHSTGTVMFDVLHT